MKLEIKTKPINQSFVQQGQAVSMATLNTNPHELAQPFPMNTGAVPRRPQFYLR